MDKTGKIHGHMTVELTNVKTGEKEKVVKEWTVY